MAISQLIFKKGNFIDTIELDIIITEGATTSSQVTTNPVQSGSDFNDHIIIKPMTFNIQGAVSNAASSTTGQFSQNAFTPRKDQSIWTDLLELQSSKKLFTLVQGLKSYKNVQIVSLSESQDKVSSNALFFNATLQEIIVPPGTAAVSQSQYADQDTFDKASPSRSGGLKQPIQVVF